MAVLSSDGTYVTVQKGDTLTQIAADYAGGYDNYKKLAAINNISNPNRIYVGQKIYLNGTGGSSSNTNSSSNTATIKQFGLQSNTDRTLFATWDWNKSNTDHYRVRWLYGTGDGVAFVGSDTTTTEKQATFNIPEQASTRVIFKVLPVSKTKTDKNNKTTSYWTAQWSPEKYYYINSLPPSVPDTPTVEIKDYKLTATVTNLEDINANQIQFQIVKDDSIVFKTGTATIKTASASYSCSVGAGADYKVRCRAVRDKLYSDWSDYSSNAGTGPSTPAGILWVKALSDTEVQLDWENVSNATQYEIQYTTEIRYFDSSNEVQSMTVDAAVAGHAEITGLTSGDEYFFRVRAINDSGKSGWTAIKSIIIGKAPSAPTTWSSTTTAVIPESITLFWIHNSRDGSSQTYADLEVYINGTKQDIPLIANSTDEDEKDKTSSYDISTSGLAEGAKLQWRVRTRGIINEWSDWSIQRTIDIYAPPTLTMAVTDNNNVALTTLTSFPFYISATAGPSTQTPIGYNVSIVSNEIYETTDQVGNIKMVNSGEAVYSRFFDLSGGLNPVELSASNIDLQNNVSYTVYCVVSMDSGLTAEATSEFIVRWTEQTHEPNAEIVFDDETYVTHIRPYCEERAITYHKVRTRTTLGETTYNVTDTTYDSIYMDQVLDGTYTTTGEQVYVGITPSGEETYYCEVETVTSLENLLLSVYRREFNGDFTELIKDVDASQKTFITDPHPSLDYARYRVVAKSKLTGAISYYDVPGYPINCPAIIIQWDEAWSNFETTTSDALEQPPWSGSLLKLPYNINVSDKNDIDVALVEYIGRKRPVSYYGTQLGETATWTVDIPKYDKDTLYALRRLAIWTGDVYVREPSGSGYWANINVSFSQKHLETIIPVTLELTRVEGGI